MCKATVIKLVMFLVIAATGMLSACDDTQTEVSASQATSSSAAAPAAPAATSTSTSSSTAAPAPEATAPATASASSASPATTSPETSASNSNGSSLPLEGATQANAFVDSIGMNVHLDFYNTSYVTQYAAFRQLLTDSGLRHIRDGLNDTTWQPYYDHLIDLAAHGIKATLITNTGESAALLQQYPERVPNVVEAYEAPNEMDSSGVSNWASDVQSFQHTLYSAVKSGALTSSFSVIGPSLTEQDSFLELGDLSNEIDYGNLHNYFAGFNPGTNGWGSAGFGSYYGSIKFNLGEEAQIAATKPVITTETGYCTVAGVRNAVSTAVQATYEPRMFLEQWNAGIIRTFQYEFIDNGIGCDGTFGLIDSSMNPKPAYYSLKNLISLLNDPGANFTPQSLHLSLTGTTSNVHRTLLEKQDGTYELALWVEVPSWNCNVGTGVPITVPPQSVSVTLTKPPSTVSTTQFSGEGSVRTSTLTPSATILLALTDNVTVLTFKF